jgi:peroxiredoxin
MIRMNRSAFMTLSSGLVLGLMIAAPAAAGIPRVGDTAADFTLKTPAGEPVRLATLNEKGPVVLVVLRGWPGYQCPICTKQVGELMAKSSQLKEAKAQVILVYPGPSDGLKGHAEEFVRGKSLPGNFSFVVDPDYTFTNSYDLRWNARGETAYPSTFVVNSQGKIIFAKSSRTHGDRARIDDVLEVLGRK